MQYLIAINQTKALEWGLNAQQAMLFAFLHQVPTWARARQIDGQTFFNISKTKIVEELPLLTDKPDTAYRMMRALSKLGLIEMTSCDNRTYMRLTPKGVTWNRAKGSEINPNLEAASEGSEKNPTSEKSPSGRGKISDPGSEKSPTNQGTNDPTPTLSGAGGSMFDRAAQQPDDETPLPTNARRFPMTLDWQPDEGELAVACLRAGLAQDLKPTTAQLALFTAHHADTGRAYGNTAWLAKLANWMRNDLRAAHQQRTRGGAAHGDHAPDQQRDGRAEREAVREQLANPHDLSWADGLWDDPADWAESGAQGAGQPAGGAGVHPAGGDLPEDVQQCVPDRGHADAGTPGAGAGAGPVAGAAHSAGGRAGDEPAKAAGEYLAADDPGAVQPAGAHGGGRRYAGGR